MANEDLKAKMREALDRKAAKSNGVGQEAPLHEKAHGSEVEGGWGREDFSAVTHVIEQRIGRKLSAK